MHIILQLKAYTEERYIAPKRQQNKKKIVNYFKCRSFCSTVKVLQFTM